MNLAVTDAGEGSYRSLVPARMDRLPWTRFHTRLVIGLGVSWILDGLEVQIAAQVGTFLQRPDFLSSTVIGTDAQIGVMVACYLLGEVVGALVFGRISDRFGRRRLFFLTLTLYLIASGATGFSFNLWSLLLFRFLAGVGIGGEYTAINSAIDELIPPYYRGRVDIAVNGTYWAGVMLAAGANVFLLNQNLLPEGIGWRIGFFIGPVIGLLIIWLRHTIPESPRWLMTRGRHEEAEQIVDQIETRIRDDGIEIKSAVGPRPLEITERGDISYRTIAKIMYRHYPARSFVGFTMMVTQSVLYNAIFFSYTTVLKNVYDVNEMDAGRYIIPFAVGNLLGPLVLGRLFDTIGRRKMITFTYCVSGLLLTITAQFFAVGWVDATSLTAFWCVIFFFASAGASSAYLTVSEIFPLELRSQAISFFFAISQLIGGVATPLIIFELIPADQAASHGPLALGYLAAGLLMIVGGAVAWRFGVDAERKSLEEITDPVFGGAGIDPGNRP